MWLKIILSYVNRAGAGPQDGIALRLRGWFPDRSLRRPIRAGSTLRAGLTKPPGWLTLRAGPDQPPGRVDAQGGL